MKDKILFSLIGLVVGGSAALFLHFRQPAQDCLSADEVRGIMQSVVDSLPQPQLNATFQSMDWGEIRKLKRVDFTFAPVLNADNLIFDGSRAEAIRTRSLPDSQDYVIYLYPQE